VVCVLQDLISSKVIYRNVMSILVMGVNSLMEQCTSQLYGPALEEAMSTCCSMKGQFCSMKGQFICRGLASCISGISLPLVILIVQSVSISLPISDHVYNLVFCLRGVS
jgi:hypothetical protein